VVFSISFALLVLLGWILGSLPRLHQGVAFTPPGASNHPPFQSINLGPIHTVDFVKMNKDLKGLLLVV